MSAQSPRLEWQRRLALSLEGILPASFHRVFPPYLSTASFHRIFPPYLSTASFPHVLAPSRPPTATCHPERSEGSQHKTPAQQRPSRHTNTLRIQPIIQKRRNTTRQEPPYSFKTVRVCINNGSTLSFEKTPRIPKSLLAASAAVKCAVNINIGRSGIVLCMTRAVSTPFITGIE